MERQHSSAEGKYPLVLLVRAIIVAYEYVIQPADAAAVAHSAEVCP
jgi:hypothetical protein